MCPTCGRQLSESTSEAKAGSNRVLMMVVGIVLLAAISFLLKQLLSGRAGQPPATTAVPGKPVLRLHGSNTIGAQLAPALAAEFLKQLGASNVRTAEGQDPDESLVVGMLPGEGHPR